MIKTVREKGTHFQTISQDGTELGDIFRTYEFEASVVYFSNYLTLHGELEGEAENLQDPQYCRKGVQSHFLHVTGPEGMYDV